MTYDIDGAIYLAERVLVLSAGPGTIKASIPVELPRPRHPDVLVSSEFIASKRTVLEEMKRVEAGLAH